MNLIILMDRGREKYPRNRPPLMECQQHWLCQSLLKDKCPNRHHPDDKLNAQSLARLRQTEKVLLILDHSKYPHKLVSLQEPDLPLTIDTKQKVIEFIPGCYYQGIFLKFGVREAILGDIRNIGEFSMWQVERRLLEDYYTRQYKLGNGVNANAQRGQIKVNQAGMKVLLGHKGERFYLEKVNQFGKYPLLHGSKVEYILKNPQQKPQIVKVDHPEHIRLCGLVKVDKYGQFYFISRNQVYDDMYPNKISLSTPDFPQVSHLFPYSILRINNTLSEPVISQTNNKLKQFLFRGKFRGWPVNNRFPIIELLEQIEPNNFGSLKRGIIYESGIQPSPFAKKEKTEADRISKEFKIASYLKNRTIVRQGVFTVDGSHTKCHDDAISIEQVEKGFNVEIYIADVAELIKRGSYLDEAIKGRDQTIYIRNYYQPMISDSLRNLLSLTQDSDKVAYSLSFKVTEKGLIDFNSISFFKSVINVEANLKHERLSRRPEGFPELKQLDSVLEKAGLTECNYLLEGDSWSEAAISRLLLISAIVPTYLLEANTRRVKQYKTAFDDYVRRITQARTQIMQKWEQNITKINDLKKMKLQIQKEEKDIIKLIEKEVAKKRDQITRRLKEQQKKATTQQRQAKKKKKQQKKVKKQMGEMMSEDEVSDEDQDDDEDIVSDAGLSIDKTSVADIKLPAQSQEDFNDQQEKQQKEKRKKAAANVKDVELSSSQESIESDEESEDQGIVKGEQFRINSAINGKKYLDKIFSHFKLDVEWTMKGINAAFANILSRDKGKLYQQFFKRMQIMNRQHFPYIVSLEKNKGNIQVIYKKNENPREKETIIQQKKDKDIERAQQKEEKKRNRQKKQQSKEEAHKQEEKNSQKKEQSKVQEQKLIQENKQVIPVVANKSQKIKPAIKQQKPNKKESKKRNRHEKQLKTQKQKPAKSQIFQISEVDLSKPDEHDEQIVKLIQNKITDREQTYIQKYVQLFTAKEKIQFSDDEDIAGLFDETLLKRIRAIKRRQMLHFLRKTTKNEETKPKTSIRRKPIHNHMKKEIIVEQMSAKKSAVMNRQSQLQPKIESENQPHEQQQKKQAKAVIEKETKNKEKKYNKKEIISKIHGYIKRNANKGYYFNKYSSSIRRNPIDTSFNEFDKEIFQKGNGQIKNIDDYLKEKTSIIKMTVKQLLKAGKKVGDFNVEKQDQKINKSDKKQYEKMENQHLLAEQILEDKPAKQPIKQMTDKTDLKSQNSHIKQEKQQTTIVKVKIPQQQQGIKQQKCDEISTNIPVNEKLVDKEVAAIKPKKQPKLSKKAQQKKIADQLKPFMEQSKEKYREKTDQLKTLLKETQVLIQNEAKEFRKELISAQKDYNIIRLIAEEPKQIEDEGKKQKKAKKKGKKQKTKQKKSAFTSFLQNFMNYAKKADYSFKKMSDEEIDDILSTDLKMEDICPQQRMKEVNTEAFKLGSEEESLLKWNNPIRSYCSLRVMRLIREYSWFFRSRIYPTDAIRFHNEIKDIEKEVRAIQDYKERKAEKAETNKKSKQANRQISKLEFYQMVKKNLNAVYVFLNVGSPTPKVKLVYHSILQELEVENMDFQQEIYKEVKGKVLVVREFPLELRVVLQK